MKHCEDIKKEDLTGDSFFLSPGAHIHFIGIGGSSMSGLAQITAARGYRVTGSDRTDSDKLNKLRGLGIEICIGHDEKNLSPACSLVVYTLAIAKDNPEYCKARKLGIPTIERGVYLGILTKEHPYSIAVSGTHGKTTTTSMIASILISDHKEPSVHLGGVFPRIGGNILASPGPYFVTEACEYHENFLNLFPYAGVILNIEAEHLDYYRDISQIKQAFMKFARLLPADGFLVVCGQNQVALEAASAAVCPVTTYGCAASAEESPYEYTAIDLQANERGTRFQIWKEGRFFTEIFLSIPGRHNVLNALAAAAVCDRLHCTADSISDGLSQFCGTERRFEQIGVCNGAAIIDDYAHHPTEIRATLEAAAAYASGKIWCVFQPHTYSRAKAFLHDFPAALSGGDEIIVADIYSAREKNTGDISSQMLTDTLQKAGLRAVYMPDFQEITTYLRSHIKPNDLVITLGAGDINQVGYALAENKQG